MAASGALPKEAQAARTKAQRLLDKYPGSVPVVCRKTSDSDLPAMDKKQFLVPRSMLCDQFKDTVRKHINDTLGVNIGSAQEICLSVHGTVLHGDSSMSELYSQYKADDFLLHINFRVGGQSACPEVLEVALPAADLGSQAQTENKSLPAAAAETQAPSPAPMSAEARRIFAKHPNSIPVVCEKASGSDAPGLIKNRFLVPQTMLGSEFAEVVRKHVKEESLSLTPTGKQSPTTGVASETLSGHEKLASVCLMLHSGAELESHASMRVLYEEHRGADGFLYLSYSMAVTAQSAVEATQAPQAPPASPVAAAPEPSSALAVAPPLEVTQAPQAPPASPVATALEPSMSLAVASLPEAQGQEQQDIETETEVAQPCELQQEVQEKIEVDSDDAAKSSIKTIHLPDNDPMSDVGEVEDVSPEAAKRCAASPVAEQTVAEVVTPNTAPGRAPSTGESAGQGAVVSAASNSSPQVTQPCPEVAESACFGEAARMRAKYPDRVPVICHRAPGRDAPELRKTKFLVPGKMFCSEFKYLIHQQLRQSGHQGLASDQTIYLFLKNTSPKTCTLMADLYDQHKADDGYLYFTYSLENTLGST